MHIREAKYGDLKIILDIMNDAILNTTSIYDYKIRTNEFVENWFTKKRSDNMPVLVCEINDQAVAYGSYGIFRAWDAYKFSVEHSIYVHKDFQGQGIGRQLLIALIDKAKNDGYHTMIAGIDASNQKSIGFHTKLGFFEVGRFKEVGYKFDKWLDLVFMQLMLNE
ncbi:MAG TPA: GNAT family N-acetyltransferase [Chitinophagaceae bacterium]|nr:GNAT family N-acetyltransferase [Chitinophagaceae bacterium]